MIYLPELNGAKKRLNNEILKQLKLIKEDKIIILESIELIIEKVNKLIRMLDNDMLIDKLAQKIKNKKLFKENFNIQSPKLKGVRKELYDRIYYIAKEIVKESDLTIQDFKDFFKTIEQIFLLIDKNKDISEEMEKIENEDILLDFAFHFNSKTYEKFFKYINDTHNIKLVKDEFFEKEETDSFFNKTVREYNSLYLKIIKDDAHEDISKEQFLNYLSDFIKKLHSDRKIYL